MWREETKTSGNIGAGKLMGANFPSSACLVTAGYLKGKIMIP
jgi:hypothetical protein